jgi:hypothetical protein
MHRAPIDGPDYSSTWRRTARLEHEANNTCDLTPCPYRREADRLREALRQIMYAPINTTTAEMTRIASDAFNAR